MQLFLRTLLLILSTALCDMPLSPQQSSHISGGATHDREYWRNIAKNHYAVPQGDSPIALARELSSYFASPDPELRDDLAYSILASWIGGKHLFSRAELNSLTAEWQANLRDRIGQSGTDTVLKRSFSALCLASLADRDLHDSFLDAQRYRALLDAALVYLREEKDLRGFDEKKGWIHATAHTADLLAELSANPFFTVEDQRRVLEAVSVRLATAPDVFTMGEQDRLANIAVIMMARKDFDAAAWNSWLTELDKDQAVWNDTPPKLPALVHFQNDTYFLRAVVAQSALKTKAPAPENLKPVLTLLSRR